MEFLTFEPSEFQILEEFEFDELVQRPERVRFFTMEEQVVDAYEKMIPAGRNTRYQLDVLKKEVQKLRDLYESYVIPTAETYEIREPSYGKRFSWVYPVYASNEFKPYSFPESMTPIVENSRLPNFYPRLLAALPRPLAATTKGVPYSVEEPTEFLNPDGQAPFRSLPDYVMTRTQVHEDKTIDILRVPVQGTADATPFIGYYLARRPLDIPNPLDGHAFFKANEPTFVETTSRLDDVVPSLGAVMTHGVPVTRDPYLEGLPYLKLYDVRLADIPWSEWKARFPPAEVVSVTPPVEDIPYPKVNQLSPPESLLDIYKTEYSPGISARYWLMQQEDGGNLVVDMLLSKAIDNGSVEMVPGLADVNYPDTTLEECNLFGVDFQEFVIKGLLRRSWTEDKKKNDIVKFTCVPLEFIKQERKQVGYKNRLPWKETTGTELLRKQQIDLMANRTIRLNTGKEKIAPKTPMKDESPQRRDIVAILEDTKRFAEDKLRDVREIVKESDTKGRVYTDADGRFVLCTHTTAILEGALRADRLKFYDEWTAREDGFRVCKFCGEQVNSDVMEDTDDYDDAGFKIVRTEALQQKIVVSDSIKSFIKGLEAIKGAFNMSNAIDATCFLILSLLQVLPGVDDIVPMLKMGNSIVPKQIANSDSDDARRVRGILGIAVSALILQANPHLVPRRSFGSRPLKLDGYPRDAKEPESFSIVDSLMAVLRKTFEAYPKSFHGPSVQVIRSILNTPGPTRKMILVSIDKLVTKEEVKSALAIGRQNKPVLAPAAVQTPILPSVVPPAVMNIVTRFGTCPSARPIYTSGRIPSVLQPKMPYLGPRILPTKSGVTIEPAVSARDVPAEIPKATIQARLRKKTGLTIKFPVNSDYRINLLVAGYLADVFQLDKPIQTVNLLDSPDLLRDIAEGFLYDVLRDIQGDVEKVAKLEALRKTDITLYTLIADIQTERANVNKYRATERIRFTERMAKKSDMERETLQELLKMGLAPYIMTNEDRAAIVREAEAQADVEETIEAADQPRDTFDQGEEPVGGTDHGNYGDYNAVPNNDGRDEVVPQFTDDNENAI